MSVKIATSDIGSVAAVREHHLLVDVLAWMAKVLLDRHQSMPTKSVEGKWQDWSCLTSRHPEGQEMTL
jgi:hypothetical protein